MAYNYDAFGGKEKPIEVDDDMIKKLKACADNGDATAQFRLACCYAGGWNIKKSKALSFELFQLSSSQGHALATHRLGNCYFLKLHVKTQDIPKAMECWAKSAEMGVPASMHNMGMVFNYYLQDYVKAIEWFTKAAELSFVMSQMALATIYRYGKGVKRDIQKACEWLSKAAELGHTPAQDRLFKILFSTKSKKDFLQKDEIKTMDIDDENYTED